MTDARSAVAAIIERDSLHHLAPDDVERLIAQYTEIEAERAQLRTPEVATAEPAVIFPAE
jgi:hypothetical protein